MQPGNDMSSQNAAMNTDYLQKAKSQRAGGILLLCGGLTMMTIGVGTGLSNMSFDLSFNGAPNTEPAHSDKAGLGLFIAGGVAIVSSIPLFISAATNARKARLLTGNQTTFITPHLQIRQATIGLAIPLER